MKHRHIPLFTSKVGWLPVFVFIIGAVILMTWWYNAKKNQDEWNRSLVELNSMTYAQHLQMDIMQGINITNTLKEVIISHDGEMQKFSEIAEGMRTDFIQSIQIAPNGVVTEIYPSEGNEAGKIDLIHDKDRGEISCYARDHGIITMQGPFPLKQGGTGIAVRNPVYLKDSNGEKNSGALPSSSSACRRFSRKRSMPSHDLDTISASRRQYLRGIRPIKKSTPAAQV